jgi:hypothetical protein
MGHSAVLGTMYMCHSAVLGTMYMCYSAVLGTMTSAVLGTMTQDGLSKKWPVFKKNSVCIVPVRTVLRRGLNKVNVNKIKI